MPYVIQWVEPDIFIEHNGVTVVHSYKEDEYDQPCTYWFVASLDILPDASQEFDVRMLSTWSKYEPDIKGAIKAAIDSGELKRLIIPQLEDTDLR